MPFGARISMHYFWPLSIDLPGRREAGERRIKMAALREHCGRSLRGALPKQKAAGQGLPELRLVARRRCLRISSQENLCLLLRKSAGRVWVHYAI